MEFNDLLSQMKSDMAKDDIDTATDAPLPLVATQRNLERGGKKKKR